MSDAPNLTLTKEDVGRWFRAYNGDVMRMIAWADDFPAPAIMVIDGGRLPEAYTADGFAVDGGSLEDRLPDVPDPVTRWVCVEWQDGRRITHLEFSEADARVWCASCVGRATYVPVTLHHPEDPNGPGE